MKKLRIAKDFKTYNSISKYSGLKIKGFLKTAGIEEAYQKYYSSIPREIFDKIIAADPSLQLTPGEKPKKIGKYGQWLLQMYTQKLLKLEDLEKIKEQLSMVTQLLPFLKRNNESFNINKFKSPSDLFIFLQKKKQFLTPSKKDIEENPELLIQNTYFLDNNEAELVYEDDSCIIVVPKTLKASQFYAEGTNWCTRYPDRFKEYTTDYPPDNTLWIIIFKEDPYKLRYQFHFPSQQFMNINDAKIDIYYFFAKYRDIADFFKNYYFSEEKLAKMFKNDEETIDIQINRLSDLVDPIDSERDSIRLIDSIWEEGLPDIYLEDLSFSEIAQDMYIYPENLQMVAEYLQNTYPKQIAKLKKLKKEIDWSDQIEVHSFVEKVDDEEIPQIYTTAYKNAEKQIKEETISAFIKEAFTKYFGVDFSEWYPGENISLTKEMILEDWPKFAGKNLYEGVGIEFFLGTGEEKNFIRFDKIESAIFEAEDISEVDESNFNEHLNDQLYENLPI